MHLQEVIVAFIVVAAALSLAWRWMPTSWRNGLAARLAAGGQRAGLVDAQRAEALAASLAKKSGCGACDSCSPACSSGGADKPSNEKAGAGEAPLIRLR